MIIRFNGVIRKDGCRLGVIGKCVDGELQQVWNTEEIDRVRWEWCVAWLQKKSLGELVLVDFDSF